VAFASPIVMLAVKVKVRFVDEPVHPVAMVRDLVVIEVVIVSLAFDEVANFLAQLSGEPLASEHSPKIGLRKYSVSHLGLGF